MKAQDQEIIFRLQKQDQRVIGELYDQYAPALYGVVLKIVRSEPIAQDVIQDSFIKIWKQGDRYDPRKGSLFTWMLNIARNAAIDKTRSANFRKEGRSQPLHEQGLNLTYPAESTLNPDHIGLDSAVEELEEKYRIVIDLLYFQGFTQREVQEYLNIPLGTVKSRTRIALRELRRIFKVPTVVVLLVILLILSC